MLLATTNHFDIIEENNTIKIDGMPFEFEYLSDALLLAQRLEAQYED